MAEPLPLPDDRTPDLSRSSAKAEVNVVRKLLKNAWDFDTDFFDELFPITSHTRSVYTSLMADLRRGQRWKAVPERDPTDPAKLYLPLQELLGDILQRFELHENCRSVLNASLRPSDPYLSYPIQPSLLLVGCGRHFLTSTSAQRTMPDYAFTISPLEVCLDSDDQTMVRDRLATHVQQVFKAQFNRRYAFGMVIAQNTLTLYLFDRFGALSSPRLDYHANPVQFCAIIAGLASPDEARLGFDTSIFADGKCRIRTLETGQDGNNRDVTYTVKSVLFHSPNFGGRGTACFLVYEDAAPDSLYVIKDSWVSVGNVEGKESEAFLISLARSRGVTKGISQVFHSEEVQVENFTNNLTDALVRHRKILCRRRFNLDRVHRRLVLKPYGKPLIQFASKMELLLAYHDAVQAHRQLHQVGGILHRDIKPANILIIPHGEEGDRGILIDFDISIRLDDKSPYSTKKQVGTRLFMSQNVLDGTQPQTYMDDMESFYYVLLFIAVSYQRPGQRSQVLHPLIRSWMTLPLAQKKADFIYNSFDLEIEPWFGQPFEYLLRNLHTILRAHRFITTHARAPITMPDPDQIYGDFLAHIRRALVEVSQEAYSSVIVSQNFIYGGLDEPLIHLGFKEELDDDLGDNLLLEDHDVKGIIHTSV